MRRTFLTIPLLAVMTSPALAQTDPDPAMNHPDRVAWQLFVEANAPAATAGNNNARFETWASDSDTFRPTPQWPAGAPSPLVPHVPVLVQFRGRQPGLQPHVPAPGGSGEEVRRNKAAFDFIKDNKLYLQDDLKQAFAAGKTITFPLDAIEVKANWVPASTVDASLYHTNTASDGKSYALVSMHIISKAVPNWTWATFEHRNNAGRCDYIGCRDDFGATVKYVAPKTPLGGQYPACDKTQEVKKLFTDGKLAAVWDNYCLKGSQADFTTATGLPTHLGNSVTENGFVASSSCMTCHSRASVKSDGSDAQGAGFLPNGQSPNGAPNPAWFWSNPGKPNQKLIALQADFVWAIPFCALPHGATQGPCQTAP